MKSRARRNGEFLLRFVERLLTKAGVDGELIGKLAAYIRDLLAGATDEESLKKAIDFVLDLVEDYLAGSDQEWAPMALKACEMLRRVLDIPDNDTAGQAFDEAEAVLAATA